MPILHILLLCLLLWDPCSPGSHCTGRSLGVLGYSTEEHKGQQKQSLGAHPSAEWPAHAASTAVHIGSSCPGSTPSDRNALHSVTKQQVSGPKQPKQQWWSLQRRRILAPRSATHSTAKVEDAPPASVGAIAANAAAAGTRNKKRRSSSRTPSTATQAGASAAAAASGLDAADTSRDWIFGLTAPTALVSSPANREKVVVGSTGSAVVVFDGSKSQAQMGDSITKYQWRISGPAGFKKVTEGPTASLTLGPGSYTARLAINSAKGQTSSDTVTFTVDGPAAGAETATTTQPSRQSDAGVSVTPKRAGTGTGTAADASTGATTPGVSIPAIQPVTGPVTQPATGVSTVPEVVPPTTPSTTVTPVPPPTAVAVTPVAPVAPITTTPATGTTPAPTPPPTPTPSPTPPTTAPTIPLPPQPPAATPPPPPAQPPASTPPATVAPVPPVVTPPAATPVPPPPAAAPPPPITPPPVPVPAGPAPIPPAGATVDEKFCNPEGDYDIKTKPGDWDALSACCKEATKQRVVVSQCSALPPRPAATAGPAPIPPAAPAPTTPLADFCVTSDYDFARQEDRNLWTLCCRDAKKQGHNDPDCDKAQWK